LVQVSRARAGRAELEPGPDYPGDIGRAVAELEAAGHGVAAFMVDSIFASDGILEAPEGYLAQAVEKVRAAGGLCIADEVQAGFGRSGKWWGFQCHKVVPDIVTLGKPMANGYPAGAVVTTPAIMAAFAHDAAYFSTFGGNPVACMAGLAVLDVIEREDLPALATRARPVT
jgi:4-aminobutyrate aminotransferase-like enzyme